MALDISFLSHFGLMDYSLLFTIEYNPSYVQLYSHKFKTNKKGKTKFPLVPIKEDDPNCNQNMNLVQNKSKISNQFMQLIAGMNSKKFEMKFIEHKLPNESKQQEQRIGTKHKVSFKHLDKKKMLIND